MASSVGETVASSDCVVDFPKFDVVERDPTDHHYYRNLNCQGSNTAYKKITQEWRLLSQDLPDSIYVRVYETRITLLRAAIVGAAGTPYEDGLFFFDVAFPNDYPVKPPLVYYHSFGHRINPNLYGNGMVCLSLINTWSGSKKEKWDSKQSTILQLLLSIQALVLNEQPYFNEPGYAGLKGGRYGEIKSAEYNEKVFVVCCKTTLCLLRNPPMDFKTLVCHHFRQRAVRILTACNSYRNGMRAIARVPNGNVSRKFKKDMEKVYGDMVPALERNGGPVINFVVQLAEEKEAKAKAKAEEHQARAKAKREKKMLGSCGLFIGAQSLYQTIRKKLETN